MDKGPTPLGDLLREGRARVGGINQEEAAHRIGVSSRTYGDWEREKHGPSGKRLRAISEVLEIGYEELVRSAGGGDVPVVAQAKEARAHAESAQAGVDVLQQRVSELEAEVERLQGLVRAFRAPDPDELRHLVRMAVKAELDPATAKLMVPLTDR